MATKTNHNQTASVVLPEAVETALKAAYRAVDDALDAMERPLYREAACGTQWNRTPEWEARRAFLTRMERELSRRRPIGRVTTSGYREPSRPLTLWERLTGRTEA